MTENILQNLSKLYFQGIADDISNARQISSVFPNMSDVGDIRENILLRFLKSHLPLRCDVVKGGCVFDSCGNVSNQIDLLVINDSSLRFSYFDRDSQNSKNIQTIEGSIACISVKSTLNKNTLYDSLRNVATIPNMPEKIIKNISPLIGDPRSYLRFPLKIIFAFSTELKKETILNQVKNFYRENAFFPNQKADLIIVNNFIIIEKVAKLSEQTGCTEVDYCMISNKSDKIGAYLLFYFLIKIQEATNWIPQVFLTYGDYLAALQPISAVMEV